MKTIILAAAASFMASAAAFVPVSQTIFSSTSSLSTIQQQASSSFENELGAQPPLGFWDPLGFLKDADAAKFDRLRYIELKHSRISMLAVVGYLVTEAGIRLPDPSENVSFASIPGGLAALTALPPAGIIQVIGFIGFFELAVMKDITGGEFVGDFRNDAIDFGWDTFDEETKLRKRAIELSNGRAAMMGILALLVHDKLGVSILPRF